MEPVRRAAPDRPARCPAKKPPADQVGALALTRSWRWSSLKRREEISTFGVSPVGQTPGGGDASIVLTNRPVAASHTLATPSRVRVHQKCPSSGWIAAHLTAPDLYRYLFNGIDVRAPASMKKISSDFSASQSRTIPSNPTVRIRLPSGLKAISVRGVGLFVPSAAGSGRHACNRSALPTCQVSTRPSAYRAATRDASRLRRAWRKLGPSAAMRLTSSPPRVSHTASAPSGSLVRTYRPSSVASANSDRSSPRTETSRAPDRSQTETPLLPPIATNR